YALQNKAAFVEAVNDMKTTRVKHVIMLSIELGLIKTINQSVQNREGHEIFSCNMGLDLIDEFAEWCKSVNGKPIYNSLLKATDIEDLGKIKSFDDDGLSHIH